MNAWRTRGAAVVLLLALVALVCEGGSLPHVHDEAGWNNQEHDLGYLVGLSAAGLPPAVVSAPVPLVSADGVGLPDTPSALTSPWPHRAPRAPPSR